MCHEERVEGDKYRHVFRRVDSDTGPYIEIEEPVFKGAEEIASGVHLIRLTL